MTVKNRFEVTVLCRSEMIIHNKCQPLPLPEPMTNITKQSGKVGRATTVNGPDWYTVETHFPFLL